MHLATLLGVPGLRQDQALARDVQRHWKALLVPTESGGAMLAFSPSTYDSGLPRVEAAALHFFMNFLIDPRWDRLGGPCARCDCYYIKNIVRQNKYCSPECRRNSTATAATRKALDRQKKEKLECAEEAIKLWQRGLRQQRWKEVVAQHCGVTPGFLTRAVNQQRLSEPGQKQC